MRKSLPGSEIVSRKFEERMYEIILIIFLSEGNKKQESACSASGNCLAHLVTVRENNVRRKR